MNALSRQGRHLFSADTRKDMLDWTRALNKSIELLRNNATAAATVGKTAGATVGKLAVAASPRLAKPGSGKGPKGEEEGEKKEDNYEEEKENLEDWREGGEKVCMEKETMLNVKTLVNNFKNFFFLVVIERSQFSLYILSKYNMI